MISWRVLDKRQGMVIIKVMSKKKKPRRQLTFSEQVRKVIVDCGMSRYELAKRAGIEESALSRYMSGERGLSTRTLDKLGKLLNLEVVMHSPKRS